jgi:hypothetical protein
MLPIRQDVQNVKLGSVYSQLLTQPDVTGFAQITVLLVQMQRVALYAHLGLSNVRTDHVNNAIQEVAQSVQMMVLTAVNA